MIPGFERALDGIKLNDNFSFSIQPADGYGVKDDAAMVQLPIEIFKHEGAIDFEMLKTGNVLPMRDNEGNLLQGTVVSYDQEKVLMDFNHPMAGHELHFTGKVIALREAAEDEIAHGHVHDGTHHH
jgi:FKBP-type peptidyl-prolyl cis-trans isomerase SlyD